MQYILLKHMPTPRDDFHISREISFIAVEKSQKYLILSNTINFFSEKKIYFWFNFMLVSFVIPCYNDSHILPQSLKNIDMFFQHFDHPYEIIFVDDGSQDTTLKILKLFQQQHPDTTQIIHYPDNRGKWFAVKTWVMHSRWDWFFFMDSDLSTDLKEIHSFLAQRQAGTIFIGSRVTGHAQRTWYRALMGTLSRCITNFFLHLHIYDTQCGFKLFEKKAKQLFQELRCERFAFDLELLVRAQQQGYTILELPVKWKEWAHSHVKISSYVQAFFDLLRIRKIS